MDANMEAAKNSFIESISLNDNDRRKYIGSLQPGRLGSNLNYLINDSYYPSGEFKPVEHLHEVAQVAEAYAAQAYGFMMYKETSEKDWSKYNDPKVFDSALTFVKDGLSFFKTGEDWKSAEAERGSNNISFILKSASDVVYCLEKSGIKPSEEALNSVNEIITKAGEYGLSDKPEVHQKLDNLKQWKSFYKTD